MHLAVAQCLLKNHSIPDENRFRIGVILPDAYSEPIGTANSHFRMMFCNGKRKTFDLTKFRALFQDKIYADALYLGYYFHLIQDMVYRQFVYGDYQWNPAVPGNIEKLYRDYALLNPYIIKKYQLSDDIVMPENFENEGINQLFHFNISRFLQELKTDFLPYENGDPFFFTVDMADGFIKQAAEACLHELDAVKKHSGFLDETAYAWDKK